MGEWVIPSGEGVVLCLGAAIRSSPKRSVIAPNSPKGCLLGRQPENRPTCIRGAPEGNAKAVLHVGENIN